MPDTRQWGPYVETAEHVPVSAWVRGFPVDAVVLGWSGRMVYLTCNLALGRHLGWVQAEDVGRR